MGIAGAPLWCAPQGSAGLILPTPPTGRPTTTTAGPKTAPEWPKMAHINLYDGTASAVKSDRSQGGPEMAPFLCTTGCVGLGRSVVSNIGKGSHHVCARSGGCLAEWGILGHCRRTAMVRPPRLSWSHPTYSYNNNNNCFAAFLRPDRLVEDDVLDGGGGRALGMAGGSTGKAVTSASSVLIGSTGIVAAWSTAASSPCAGAKSSGIAADSLCFVFGRSLLLRPDPRLDCEHKD